MPVEKSLRIVNKSCEENEYVMSAFLDAYLNIIFLPHNSI
ncbi:hypothetical protein GLIP_1261 [Aliiglaciecola lipolytica E3]|uniref:Uncharacterized protein n=1 Tax=Aliiglaciecola lipolytica E3 TaxID=1127673 RepID=K6Y6R0_9ALTE|nr:hypothetical protein GLIP_1261 [Aliiglaciecola lipolytica E3]